MCSRTSADCQPGPAFFYGAENRTLCRAEPFSGQASGLSAGDAGGGRSPPSGCGSPEARRGFSAPPPYDVNAGHGQLTTMARFLVRSGESNSVQGGAVRRTGQWPVRRRRGRRAEPAERVRIAEGETRILRTSTALQATSASRMIPRGARGFKRSMQPQRSPYPLPTRRCSSRP